MQQYRFDEHGKGYKVGKTLQAFRPEFKILIDWIPQGAKVLDVGCGDGVLGQLLIKKKYCNVYGFDLDPIAVKEAKRRGIKAQVWDANKKFPYSSNSFDVVVCNTSLQYIEQTDFAVSEMFRVAKKAVIVSFPNFGFWAYRLQMLSGKFPSLSLYGHTWWTTRSLRFFSLTDFFSLPSLQKRKLEKKFYINWRNRKESMFSKLLPNFFARSCILMFTKQ